MSIDDFEEHKVIGTGTFGRVTIAQHLKTNEVFAIKRLKKKHLI